MFWNFRWEAFLSAGCAPGLKWLNLVNKKLLTASLLNERFLFYSPSLLQRVKHTGFSCFCCSAKKLATLTDALKNSISDVIFAIINKCAAQNCRGEKARHYRSTDLVYEALQHKMSLQASSNDMCASMSSCNNLKQLRRVQSIPFKKLGIVVLAALLDLTQW